MLIDAPEFGKSDRDKVEILHPATASLSRRCRSEPSLFSFMGQSFGPRMNPLNRVAALLGSGRLQSDGAQELLSLAGR